MERLQEQADTATKQLASMLERFLDDPEDQEPTFQGSFNTQEPVSLESKLDEAADEIVESQSIIKRGETTALRLSRCDTNSLEDVKLEAGYGLVGWVKTTQDV